MTLNRRERTILLVVGLLVGLLLLDTLVVEPGLEQWKTLDARLAKADHALAQARQTLAREEAVRKQWEALKGKVTPEPIEDVLHFADHLWSLASTAGTSFQKLEPQKHVEPRGDYNEVSYDVQLRCTIRNLNRFLYELDGSAELLRVRHLHVGSRLGSPILDCELQISTLELAAAPPAGHKKP